VNARYVNARAAVSCPLSTCEDRIRAVNRHYARVRARGTLASVRASEFCQASKGAATLYDTNARESIIKFANCAEADELI